MLKSFNADLDNLSEDKKVETVESPKAPQESAGEKEHNKLEMTDEELLDEMKKRGKAMLERVPLSGN